MGTFDADRVEYGDGIVGHVGGPVGGPVLVDGSIAEVGRQADVTVVEPHDVEAGVDEHRAPVVLVVDALRSEPVDHEQRRIGG